MKELFYKYKHILFLSYGLFYIPCFMYLEQTVVRRYHVIHMAIDDYIPFIEFFIVPYLLWFAYIALAVGYFLLKDKNDYCKLLFFLFTGMTLFLFISAVYPNGHYLRPTAFERDNIFVKLVQGLYATDTPTNLFPSIHVYNSIAVHSAIKNSSSLKDNKLVQVISFLLMISIVMATVFLKQHSVFDVITALVLSAFMYRLVYGNMDIISQRIKGYQKQLNHI